MRFDRKSWRLGWLALGLSGLVALSLDPFGKREPTADQRAALIEALWNLDEAQVAALIRNGVSANTSLDERNTRPLHLLFFGPGCSLRERPTAVATGRIAGLLIENGADVNAADRRRNTPLMLAAAACDSAIVGILLAAGADMYSTNLIGLTPFEMTLANVSDAAEALLAAGFRLTPEALARYRRIYHDEPAILALLDRASR